MIKCGAAPYEGKEEYMFVSCCREDGETVFPLLESLAKKGYRIWYDEGINPGSDRSEIIDEYLERCAVFLAVITGSLPDSHSCRREINRAFLQGKPVVSVFLEETPLSAGMEMQLSSVRSVHRKDYGDSESFLEAICREEALEPCKGTLSEGVLIDKDRTVKRAEGCRYMLVRKITKERIYLEKPDFRVGRKAEVCDYAIEDDRTVSRIHAVFNVAEDKELYVLDNNSLNRVYINGRKIEPMENTQLHDGDEIRLGNERFDVVIDRD